MSSHGSLCYPNTLGLNNGHKVTKNAGKSKYHHDCGILSSLSSCHVGYDLRGVRPSPSRCTTVPWSSSRSPRMSSAQVHQEGTHTHLGQEEVGGAEQHAGHQEAGCCQGLSDPSVPRPRLCNKSLWAHQKKKGRKKKGERERERKKINYK